MPAADYTLRQGDHGETLTGTLEDAAGAPLDIAAATIQLRVSPIGGGIRLLDDADASNDQNDDGSDGSKGKVSYVWQVADTEVPGLFLAGWKVTYAGGEVQSFPNGGYLLIRITPNP